jgi:replicative DNA helicase
VSVAQALPDFERTPPHDLAAEQCVLGGMLMSKDAISDVMEVIRPADHYRPAHQTIHEAILDLYGRGEPVDPVTISDLLTKRGELTRVGGGAYLHTLIACVPTAANAGYYARIVRERAILRRLVEAGTRIVQLGYSGDGDADQLVDRAEAEIYGVAGHRVSEDYQQLANVIPATLDELEAIGSRSGAMAGVPTGFTDLDALTNGLHAGQMIVIAARPALGKALALDTPLPTPAGWTTMGDINVGDRLLGADGHPVTVTGATPVITGRPCYEVEFCDGEVIVADAQHQWLTFPAPPDATGTATGPEGPAQVLTTAHLSHRLSHGYRYTVPATPALELPPVALPLPAYELGTRLAVTQRPQPSPARATAAVAGDGGGVAAPAPTAGGRRPAAGSGPRTAALAAEAARPRDGRAGVADAGGAIPAPYLRASPPQRRELLAGILDTVAVVTGGGRLSLVARGQRFADSVCELLTSLGCQPTVTRHQRGGDPGYTVAFRPTREALAACRAQHLQRLANQPLPRCPRWITAVRPVAARPVRCVQVDRPDGLYLAGRAMVPTHNSTLALDIARAAAIKHSLPSVIFSLEMSRNEITMRLLSAEARVPLHSMRTGQMGEEDWSRLARRMSQIVDAPLFIDDSPNMSLMEIRAKCRRLKQRHDLRLVIVDYLQLMSSPRRIENRQQEVSEMSRSLKLLAKELDVPLIAVSQLNRGPEQRTDKRPLLSDLRESGCLTGDTALARADTCGQITFTQLMSEGWDDVLVWSADQHGRLIPAPITRVFFSGMKDIFRLQLRGGREVKASANHRFMTPTGWKALQALQPGDQVAINARAPRAVGAGPASTCQVGRNTGPVSWDSSNGQAGPDVTWDQITAIDPLGNEPVFDATIEGTHNFVANGIIAHNSIEQDSDVVILLHREDAYERESPRAGEADLIIAKHRNGPVTTVTVAFQGHYSRFVDMASL